MKKFSIGILLFVMAAVTCIQSIMAAEVTISPTWKLDGTQYSSPVTGPNGALYCYYKQASGIYYLRAFDSQGNIIWTSNKALSDTRSSNIVVGNNTIYLTDTKNFKTTIHAFDTKTGSQKWETNAELSWYKPIISLSLDSNNNLYYNRFSVIPLTTIFKMDHKSHKIKRLHFLSLQFFYKPYIGENGKIYMLNGLPVITKTRPTIKVFDGKKLEWSTNSQDKTSVMLAVKNNALYVAALFEIHAINMADKGKTDLWIRNMPDASYTIADFILGKSAIYIARVNNSSGKVQIIKLDASTGKIIGIWDLLTKEPPTDANSVKFMALGANSRLYIQQSDPSGVFAFDLKQAKV